MRLPAERENFTVLQVWLTEIAGSLELTDKEKRQILVSCDEIFTNTVSYAYADEAGGGYVEISVSFSPALRQLQIRFRDQGKAFDPLHTETPDVTKPLTRRKIGGLGLFMVKKMMDKLEYQRLDGCNILTLTKNCTGEGK